MTQRLGLAKALRFVVIKPDSTAEAQGGERRLAQRPVLGHED
jgi:hypothetical protein